MGSTPIRLTLERDELSLDDLSGAVAAFAGYLEQLDLGQSPSGKRTLDFRVATLSYNTPLLLEAMSEPREDMVDNGPALAALAIRGAQEIAGGTGRPSRVSDEALEHLRRLAGYSVNGHASVTISAPSLSIAAPLTSALVGQVDRVLSQGDSIGSIEGKLDTISVHIRPFFTLYDALTGRGVRCYFGEDRRALVLKSLGKKMLAHGRIRRDPGGFPKELRDLDRLDPLGESGGASAGLAGILRGVDVLHRLGDVRGE